MDSAPHIQDIEKMMESWTLEELNAFYCCVRLNDKKTVPARREELISGAISELFWAYNSRVFAEAKQHSAAAKEVIYEHLPKALKTRLPRPDSPAPLHEHSKRLTYDFLVRETCKKLDIKDAHCESLDMLEMYLAETIIIRAVAGMTAPQRHDFLTRAIDVRALSVEFSDSNIKGPLTTLAALSAAQASGFGVYLGATTALGFLSHAVGVTLPFAVYTGMTSTIAFVIGPVGFLATAGWLGYILTSPEWMRITRGLMHIVAMRAKYGRSAHHDLALSARVPSSL